MHVLLRANLLGSDSGKHCAVRHVLHYTMFTATFTLRAGSKRRFASAYHDVLTTFLTGSSRKELTWHSLSSFALVCLCKYTLRWTWATLFDWRWLSCWHSAPESRYSCTVAYTQEKSAALLYQEACFYSASIFESLPKTKPTRKFGLFTVFRAEEK